MSGAAAAESNLSFLTSLTSHPAPASASASASASEPFSLPLPLPISIGQLTISGKRFIGTTHCLLLSMCTCMQDPYGLSIYRSDDGRRSSIVLAR